MTETLLIFYFLLGISFGSFGSTLIYRSMQGLSVLKPPYSFCPKCKNRIKWYHNIPVISYIFLKGKCAYCGEKIDILYLITEISSGVLAIFCFALTGSVIEFITMFFFTWGMLIAAISDIKFLALPSMSVIISLISSIAHSVEFGEIKNSISGALLGAGILLFVKITYKLIRKKEGLGEGDVLFMIPVGVYFGILGTVLILIFSSFLGGMLGTFLTLRGKREIPFMPFIFVASIMVILIRKLFPDFFKSFTLSI